MSNKKIQKKIQRKIRWQRRSLHPSDVYSYYVAVDISFDWVDWVDWTLD